MHLPLHEFTHRWPRSGLFLIGSLVLAYLLVLLVLSSKPSALEPIAESNLIGAGGGKTVHTGVGTTTGVRTPISAFRYGVNLGGTHETSLILTTVSATPLVSGDDVRYMLRGTANLSPSAAGHGAYACFQVRKASEAYAENGCSTDRVARLRGNYSFETHTLAPATEYRFRAFGYDRTTRVYYWGEEIAFTTPPGTPDFYSGITSFFRELGVEFTDDLGKDTNTITLTTFGDHITENLVLRVGDLADDAGRPVSLHMMPFVYLDNSFLPASSKILTFFPAVTNIRLSFPMPLPEGLYMLPVSIRYGNAAPEQFAIPVRVRNFTAE